MGAAAFVQHAEAMGARDRGANLVEAQGGEGAQVPDLDGVFVFVLQILGGLVGELGHLAVGDEGGVGAGADEAGAPDRAIIGIPGERVLAASIQGLVLEEQDGVAVFGGGEHGVERILGGRGIEGLQAGEGEQGGLKFLGVEGAEGEAAAAGQAHEQGHPGAGAKMIGGGVQDELGEGFGDEIRELKLDHRQAAAEGQADGVAGAGGLGERGVENPGAAVGGEKSLGDLEGASVVGDVLAEKDRLGAFAEEFGVGEVDRLGGGEGSHGGAVGCDLGAPRVGG